MLDPALVAFYLARKEEVGDDGLIFDFAIDSYRRAFARTLASLGLSDLDGPHVLRHSGAIFYYHYEGWDLPSIQERGRWGSLESVHIIGSPTCLSKAKAGPRKSRTLEASGAGKTYLGSV